jgi:hypothetical protein
LTKKNSQKGLAEGEKKKELLLIFAEIVDN